MAECGAHYRKKKISTPNLHNVGNHRYSNGCKISWRLYMKKCLDIILVFHIIKIVENLST